MKYVAVAHASNCLVTFIGERKESKTGEIVGAEFRREEGNENRPESAAIVK